MAIDMELPELAAKVRPWRLEERLVAGGWRFVAESHGGRAKVYDRGGAEVLLPLEPTFGDYRYRVLDAIEAIAKTEGTELAALTREMAGPPADHYQFRYVADSTRDGTVPLDVGCKFVKSCAKMWRTAGREEGRAGGKGRADEDAKELRRESRLGPSSVGPYVVTIIALDRGADERPEALANHGRVRRVGARLMNALDRVSKYTAATPRAQIVETPNKSLDTAIAESMEAVDKAEPNAQVEISARWIGPPGAEGDAPQRVVYGPLALANASRVRTLLTLKDETEDRRIKGRVVATQEVDAASEKGRGWATIQLENDERFPNRSVKVFLGPEHFGKARDLMANGTREGQGAKVEAVGTLQFGEGKGSLVLEDYRAFHAT